MNRAIMNDEFDALTADQQRAVLQAVAIVRNHGQRKTVPLADGGEAYAYPHADGIAWGYNRAEDGFNAARGVTP